MIRTDPKAPAAEAVVELQRQVCRIVQEEGVRVLQERTYGPLAAGAAIRAARTTIAKSGDGVGPHAATCVHGRLDADLGVSGATLWGIIPDSPAISFEVVELPGGQPASRLQGPDFEWLYVPAIAGDVGLDLPAHAAAMFDRAAATLATFGLGYRDVARTWFHLPRILDWYDEFNGVRADAHRRHGITGAPDAPFPASTGVEGYLGPDRCGMDLLAVRTSGPRGPRRRTLEGSRRQARAAAYGSQFTRGVVLADEHSRTVWVSGTASIDRAGHTLHAGSREAQVTETLLGVAALLAAEGARLRDLCFGTLFCKDVETLGVYADLVRLLDLDDLPLVPVLADICRADLFVEIDAVAAVSGDR